jgi:hypothetical protein
MINMMKFLSIGRVLIKRIVQLLQGHDIQCCGNSAKRFVSPRGPLTCAVRIIAALQDWKLGREELLKLELVDDSGSICNDGLERQVQHSLRFQPDQQRGQPHKAGQYRASKDCDLRDCSGTGHLSHFASK